MLGLDFDLTVRRLFGALCRNVLRFRVLQEMNKEFYCETCNKQYKTVGEMSNHYSSYDHHHVKVRGEEQAGA